MFQYHLTHFKLWIRVRETYSAASSLGPVLSVEIQLGSGSEESWPESSSSCSLENEKLKIYKNLTTLLIVEKCSVATGATCSTLSYQSTAAVNTKCKMNGQKSMDKNILTLRRLSVGGSFLSSIFCLFCPLCSLMKMWRQVENVAVIIPGNADILSVTLIHKPKGINTFCALVALIKMKYSDFTVLFQGKAHWWWVKEAAGGTVCHRGSTWLSKPFLRCLHQAVQIGK